MNWIPLTNLEQLESIGDAEGYSVIFKHSTRCSVSLMAKKRFEHDWDAIPAATSVYFLDLISNREISNTIMNMDYRCQWGTLLGRSLFGPPGFVPRGKDFF